MLVGSLLTSILLVLITAAISAVVLQLLVMLIARFDATYKSCFVACLLSTFLVWIFNTGVLMSGLYFSYLPLILIILGFMIQIFVYHRLVDNGRGASITILQATIISFLQVIVFIAILFALSMLIAFVI